MTRPRALLNMNFRTKVLVPVVACMIVLMVTTFFVVKHRITEQVRTQGESTMDTAETAFRYAEKMRTRNFLLRFQNLPNNPPWVVIFKSSDARNDPKTYQIPLKNLLEESGVHVVLYTSAGKGTLDCEARDPALSKSAFEAAVGPSVRQALLGDKTADTVLAGEQLYDVVSIPAFSPSRELIGVLTLGSELDAAAVHEFSDLTHSEIALLADGRIIASTMSGQDASAQFVSAFIESLPANGNSDGLANKRHRMVGGEHYFSAAGRLTSLGGEHTLGYVLLNNAYEKSLLDAQVTQLVLLGFSFCAILFGAGIIWFLVSKVTRPLGELRDSAEAVGRGDFSRRVKVRSNDECGELAAVFNRMTENLQQSRAELEETVETLKSTQAQLVQSEKLSGVGEFVAGVTHELNNPLAAVIGFSEMLKETDVDTKHRRYLDMIHKSAQRCQKIVQSLLSFARRHQPERTAVSMNSLIEGVLEIIQYQLRTGNIEVIMRLDPNLPVVLADQHQLQQVFLNIINNARQAMEAHPSQSPAWIKILTEASDQNVRIVIQDNGPGIPEENLRRIFDPFFTTKEVGKGTGLGLSLCYGIIREHGGNITPMSKPGEGATFIIELPITEVSGANTEILYVQEAAPRNPHEGAGKKILVIDDEEPILEMVREELTRHGYEVEVASSGEAGLRRLKKNHCDVVFCDWKMPGLNGRQVYETLRTTKPDLCQRVVFITGDVINEPMREFLEKENRLCLAKPFTLAEFRDAIKAVLKDVISLQKNP